ncbi:DNA-binding response regulator [Lentzea sp. NPDC058436]|uniref:DNA-binding response regulator n=1 Tax=Lentzea sp. NPDC058436 TaxID=3346499 RepID=UPI00365AD1F7
MDIPVAVVDPLPIFQTGVVAALSGRGCAIVAQSDIIAWIQRPGPSVVLFTVRAESDWEVLDRLLQSAGRHLVIVVLDNVSAHTGARAVQAGAVSVISRDSTVERLRQVVESTCDGQAVMPAEVAAALARGPVADNWVPSPEQLLWLRRLAAGSTVEQLAKDAGYSERAMYRLLKVLYDHMEVGTRLEAIMYAQRHNWV